jgi:hypothetical protein
MKDAYITLAADSVELTKLSQLELHVNERSAVKVGPGQNCIPLHGSGSYDLRNTVVTAQVGVFLDHYVGDTATVGDAAIVIVKQLFDPRVASLAAAALINTKLAAASVANMPFNEHEHESSRYNIWQTAHLNPVLEVSVWLVMHCYM